jgi:hypothetical protein
MTDQNDLHNRSPAPDKTAYGWIIGGVAAVAVIFGIFTMYRHNNNYTAPTADRGVVTTPATAPTTRLRRVRPFKPRQPLVETTYLNRPAAE